jgi:hypothetical protein
MRLKIIAKMLLIAIGRTDKIRRRVLSNGLSSRRKPECSSSVVVVLSEYLQFNFINLVSSIVENVETRRLEVILHIRGGVDLNSSQARDAAVGDSWGGLGDDLVDHLGLGIQQGVRKLGLNLLGTSQAGGVGHQHVANHLLLSVNRGSDGGKERFSSLGVGLGGGQDVGAGGVGATAACSSIGTANTLNSTDVSVGADTNVGSVADKAVSAIRDVSSHGSETDNSAEGESSQTSHAEVVSVSGIEGLFKRTRKLVATQRSSDKGVGGSESLGSQCGSDLGHKFLVRKSLGEELLDGALEETNC